MRPRLEVCIFGYLGLRRIRRTSEVAKAYWGYFWGHSEFLSCRNLALMRVAGDDVSPVHRRVIQSRRCWPCRRESDAQLGDASVEFPLLRTRRPSPMCHHLTRPPNPQREVCETGQGPIHLYRRRQCSKHARRWSALSCGPYGLAPPMQIWPGEPVLPDHRAKTRTNPRISRFLGWSLIFVATGQMGGGGNDTCEHKY